MLTKEVILPCKVGEMFYGLQETSYFKYMALAIKIYSNRTCLVTTYGMEFEFGTEAFLTKQEAENALRKRV